MLSNKEYIKNLEKEFNKPIQDITVSFAEKSEVAKVRRLEPGCHYGIQINELLLAEISDCGDANTFRVSEESIFFNKEFFQKHKALREEVAKELIIIKYIGGDRCIVAGTDDIVFLSLNYSHFERPKDRERQKKFLEWEESKPFDEILEANPIFIRNNENTVIIEINEDKIEKIAKDYIIHKEPKEFIRKLKELNREYLLSEKKKSEEYYQKEEEKKQRNLNNLRKILQK